MELKKVKNLMGENFIGPEELKVAANQLEIKDPSKFRFSIPQIPFTFDNLKKYCKDYILILGIPEDKYNNKLTINCMVSIFGRNPGKSEPCFYNQDWYLGERFAKETTLEYRWYLIKKTIDKNSRGINPEYLLKKLTKQESFPSAVLTVYVFFVYYLLTNKILWKNDFIWCSDKDVNGDQIYTGRYIDPKGINKNGFNIHRYLRINNVYGFCPQFTG